MFIKLVSKEVNFLIRIFRYLKKREGLFALVSLIFVVIQVWLDLKIPDYMSGITNVIQSDSSNMNSIFSFGIKMLACALSSLAASFIVSILASKISSNYGAELRSLLFRKVQSFSLEETSHFSTSSLITRTTNDITQIQTIIVMGLQVIIKAPILAIWAIIKISDKSWQWTLSTGVSVLVLLIIVGLCIGLALPKMKKIQNLTDKITTVTRENLTGIQVVRAYNASDYQERKLDKANRDLTNANLYANTSMAFMLPGIQTVMSGLTLSIYWLGAYLIDSASFPRKIELFSDMIVFSSYAMQVIMAFMMLVMIFMLLPRATVSSKRILEVLNTETKITDGKLESVDSNLKGTIEFKKVGLKYANADKHVLRNISFTASQGETLAIIGATGSGKSSVVNLIPRFYDVTEGSVLVNGINVKEYKQHELRNIIGYVSQKAVIFKGTVSSNIAFGDNGSKVSMKSDIIDSVYTAQASEFVEKMDKGYDSEIAQGGINLSGGQKQRLSIARAINRRAEIMIFDDSFSALDYKTDYNLRKSLSENNKDATKLIVAQRIGTIIDADKIIVLDQGEIVGVGTHDELMSNCQVYQQIAYSQLSKEELFE